MAKTLRLLAGVFITALLIGGPWAYACFYQGNLRSFHEVRDGVLYRSGQLSLSGLKRVLHDYEIKTVISLRDSGDPKEPQPDMDEERYCRMEGIPYHRIPPGNWWPPDPSAPAEKGLRKFLEIMDDPANHPVLVHCFAGVHRTGAFCAVYRMEKERWSNEDALAELRAAGYSTLDDDWDLLEFLERYRPSWQRPAGEVKQEKSTGPEERAPKRTKKTRRRPG